MILGVYVVVIDGEVVSFGDSYSDIRKEKPLSKIANDYMLVQRKFAYPYFAGPGLLYMTEQYKMDDDVLSIEYYRSKDGRAIDW